MRHMARFGKAVASLPVGPDRVRYRAPDLSMSTSSEPGRDPVNECARFIAVAELSLTIDPGRIRLQLGAAGYERRGDRRHTCHDNRDSRDHARSVHILSMINLPDGGDTDARTTCWQAACGRRAVLALVGWSLSPGIAACREIGLPSRARANHRNAGRAPGARHVGNHQRWRHGGAGRAGHAS